MKEDHTKINGQIKRLNKRIDSQTIPIGLIYIELPFESNSSWIWLLFQWMEVTLQCVNLFFRVEGDRGASFGQVQQGGTHRLSQIENLGPPNNPGVPNGLNVITMVNWSFHEEK